MDSTRMQLASARAIHLAVVYLTRRTDLRVVQPPDDYGVDLLVHIVRGDKGEAKFGVETEARLSMRSDSAFRDVFHRPVSSNGYSVTKNMPVYLFLFSMDTDEGYYKALTEAYQAEADQSGKAHEGFKKLDERALDDIIMQVKQWYEAPQRVTL